MRRMDKCLIFGSIPPRYSKARWRIMFMLMLTEARSHFDTCVVEKTRRDIYLWSNYRVTVLLNANDYWLHLYLRLIDSRKNSQFIWPRMDGFPSLVSHPGMLLTWLTQCMKSPSNGLEKQFIILKIWRPPASFLLKMLFCFRAPLSQRDFVK